jgi:integrase
VNNALGLLKQIFTAAVDWGILPTSPLHRVKKLRQPRRETLIWTLAESRRFLLDAPGEWRSMWVAGLSAGLRPSEVLPMEWTTQNWPDFTANQIHVTCGYEATSKALGPPKTDLSVREVDMVPAVRQALLTLPNRALGGLVFPRRNGRMFAYSTMSRAWRKTIEATGVRPIRPYDLRHIFASLLIMAGKNPLTPVGKWATIAPGLPSTPTGT